MDDAILIAGGDEVAEEWVRLKRLGLELGVELAAQEEGVSLENRDFRCREGGPS